MHPDFQLPSKGTIHGRSSSITASFFTAITPVVEPNENEVEEALKVLGMSRGHCVCAYCGMSKSEWDHFRPIVEKQLPTGFITEIANLVPSCGKCNQSKGNKHWKQWMLCSAKGSPKSRSVLNLAARVARLEAYEKWKKPVKLDYVSIVGEELWIKHLSNWKALLMAMSEAQTHASNLRAKIDAHFRQPNVNPDVLRVSETLEPDSKP
jgi:hypothetical protein